MREHNDQVERSMRYRHEQRRMEKDERESDERSRLDVGVGPRGVAVSLHF